VLTVCKPEHMPSAHRVTYQSLTTARKRPHPLSKALHKRVKPQRAHVDCAGWCHAQIPHDLTTPQRPRFIDRGIGLLR